MNHKWDYLKNGAAAATQGVWYWDAEDNDIYALNAPGYGGNRQIVELGDVTRAQDAYFISEASPETVKELIADCEMYEALAEELDKKVDAQAAEILQLKTSLSSLAMVMVEQLMEGIE